MKSIVINLPQRLDRLFLFKQEIKYTNFNPLRINGVINHNPIKGIGQAHINAILLAKQNEWPSVLIMEDDIVFNGKEKTMQYIEEALNNKPEDWDILLGGIYYGKPKKHNEYWSKINEFCGLQFYIINSKAYDKILEYDFSLHIDRWIGKSGLNIYVANKFFATQRNGLSDNTKKNENYSHLLQKYKLL